MNRQRLQGGQGVAANSTDTMIDGATHEQGGVSIGGGAVVEDGENVRQNPVNGQQEIDSARLGTAQANRPLMIKKGELEQQLQMLNGQLKSVVESVMHSNDIHKTNAAKLNKTKLEQGIEQAEQGIAQLEQEIEANFNQQQQLNGNNGGEGNVPSPEEQGMPMQGNAGVAGQSQMSNSPVRENGGGEQFAAGGINDEFDLNSIMTEQPHPVTNNPYIQPQNLRQAGVNTDFKPYANKPMQPQVSITPTSYTATGTAQRTNAKAASPNPTFPGMTMLNDRMASNPNPIFTPPPVNNKAVSAGTATNFGKISGSDMTAIGDSMSAHEKTDAPTKSPRQGMSLGTGLNLASMGLNAVSNAMNVADRAKIKPAQKDQVAAPIFDANTDINAQLNEIDQQIASATAAFNANPNPATQASLASMKNKAAMAKNNVTQAGNKNTRDVLNSASVMGHQANVSNADTRYGNDVANVNNDMGNLQAKAQLRDSISQIPKKVGDQMIEREEGQARYQANLLNNPAASLANYNRSTFGNKKGAETYLRVIRNKKGSEWDALRSQINVDWGL